MKIKRRVDKPIARGFDQRQIASFLAELSKELARNSGTSPCGFIFREGQAYWFSASVLYDFSKTGGQHKFTGLSISRSAFSSSWTNADQAIPIAKIESIDYLTDSAIRVGFYDQTGQHRLETIQENTSSQGGLKELAQFILNELTRHYQGSATLPGR